MLEPGRIVRSPRGTVIEIRENSPERFSLRRTLPPSTGKTPAHRHTNGVEIFRVIDGEVTASAAGATRRLTAGDELAVPLGASHVHPHTDSNTIAVIEQTIEPRPRFVEVFFATWLKRLEAGDVDSQDEPKLLDVLAVIRIGGGGTWVAGPPVVVQKALAQVLGRIRST
jgi:mannose-6-phosphate isomerase-like protein (cupin superfamily)